MCELLYSSEIVIETPYKPNQSDLEPPTPLHVTMCKPRVEAGRNTSTIAVGFVGDDEKRTRCLVV
jgi:hypothetical protein